MLFFLSGTALLNCSVAALTVETLSIQQLKIAGAHHVKKSEVLKVINSKPPSMLSFLPFVHLPKFDRGVFNDDMARIAALYQSYGYYRTQVTPAVDTDAQKKTVRITITIDEGKPTRISAVTVTINSAEERTLRPVLEAQVLLHPGDQFRTELYDRTKQRIDQYLGNNGYVAPTITGRAVVDRLRYRADLFFDVTTGPLQFFGPVSLSGNDRISAKDILREVTFKEGEKYTRTGVYGTQHDIYRLNLFNSVVLTPEAGQGKTVPINIRVDEKELRTLSLGLGYGSEDKVRAQATWNRRYLGGMPRTLTLGARYSSLLISGAVDLTQLYFIDRLSSLGLHAGYDREYAVSYSNERISSQVRVGRTFGRNIEGFAAYNLEVNRPVSISQATVQELTDTNPGSYYFISGLLFGARYDTVKDNLYPLYGSMFSLFFEPATYLLGSKVDYARMIGEGRIYFPVMEQNILAARLRVGAIQPLRFTQIIPIFKRFFSGGSNSVRGYAYQSLGPTDASGNPIGGDYLVEGNLEARYPVYGDLKGVIFLDAGNVYANRMDISISSLKYATGIGARYTTVVGPVRFDIAFPLDPFPELAWGRYALYVSLGNAF